MDPQSSATPLATLPEANAQHARAVELLAEGQSIRAVAAELGVSRRTLHRWLERVEVQAALSAARRGAVEAVRSTLVAAAHGAVGVLEAVAKDEQAPHAARVAAAREILARALGPHDTVDTARAIDGNRAMLAAAVGGEAELRRAVLGALGDALGGSHAPAALPAGLYQPPAEDEPEDGD